jgi:hypothetical protein
MLVRPADATLLPEVERIVRDAYTSYIIRIGKPPGPMQDGLARVFFRKVL